MDIKKLIYESVALHVIAEILFFSFSVTASMTLILMVLFHISRGRREAHHIS